MNKAKNGQSKGFHSKKQDNEINSPDTTDIATNDSKDIFTSSQNNTAKDTWQEVKLGDIIKLKYGKECKNIEKGGIPTYGSGGIIKYINQFLYNKESILIPRKGTLNNIFYINKPFWTIDTMFYSEISENINAKYIYYYLTLIDFNLLNVGSAVPSLTIQILNDVPIKLPPLETQRKIAEILSSLDDKIDLLHKQNQSLESLAQTLFEYHFIHNAKAEWEEKPLSYFGKIICGKTPSKKNNDFFGGEMPFIKIPDMHGNIFIFKTTDSLTQLGKQSQNNKTLPKFSICVSCIATVGIVSMNTDEAQTNQQINSIIPNEIFYRYYLFLYLKHSHNEIKAMASGGTVTMNLNTADFSKMMIAKPSDTELQEFHIKVKNYFSKIYQNSKQIESLKSLRDIMLPKLLNGEIKI